MNFNEIIISLLIINLLMLGLVVFAFLVLKAIKKTNY